METEKGNTKEIRENVREKERQKRKAIERRRKRGEEDDIEIDRVRETRERDRQWRKDRKSVSVLAAIYVSPCIRVCARDRLSERERKLQRYTEREKDKRI